MTGTETNARPLAELLAQVGRTAYCIGSGEDLRPGQWMALRYFSRANRFSRTVRYDAAVGMRTGTPGTGQGRVSLRDLSFLPIPGNRQFWCRRREHESMQPV